MKKKISSIKDFPLAKCSTKRGREKIVPGLMFCNYFALPHSSKLAIVLEVVSESKRNICVQEINSNPRLMGITTVLSAYYCYRPQ
jgi:hypothetical protein